MRLTPTLARRVTIAGIEIFGGLYGFSMTAPLIMTSDSWLWRGIVFLMCGFYVACFAAGLLLLKGNDLGASLSLYLQAPQLVFVYSSTLAYHLYAGFSAALLLTTPFSFGLSFDAGAKAWLRVGLELEHATVGVNLFAVVVLWQLLTYLEAQDALRSPEPAPTLGGTV